MALVHRVAPLLGPIAPPGSARWCALRFGYRAVTSLPKLKNRRYLATHLATTWDSITWKTSLFFCRDPLEKERIKGAGGTRWRIILESLAFPSLDRPRVSILIAVCNRYWSTLACLDAISSRRRPGLVLK